MRNDTDSAEVLFLAALGVRLAEQGPDHPSVATTLVGLADFYLANGRTEAADSAYRTALRIRESTLPSEHPGVSVAELRMAMGLAAQGMDDQAEALAGEA